MSDVLTLGVEEEYLVVDGSSGALVPRSDQLEPHAKRQMGDAVTTELNLCQIEVATPVCRTLDDVRDHLSTLRLQLSKAAEETGFGVAAAGTHPFSLWQDQQVDLRKDRYRRMVENYQLIARQQVICGCHVHVGIADPNLAVGAMTRVRPGSRSCWPSRPTRPSGRARTPGTPATAPRCGSAGRPAGCHQR